MLQQELQQAYIINYEPIMANSLMWAWFTQVQTIPVSTPVWMLRVSILAPKTCYRIHDGFWYKALGLEVNLLTGLVGMYALASTYTLCSKNPVLINIYECDSNLVQQYWPIPSANSFRTKDGKKSPSPPAWLVSSCGPRKVQSSIRPTIRSMQPSVPSPAFPRGIRFGSTLAHPKGEKDLLANVKPDLIHCHHSLICFSGMWIQMLHINIFSGLPKVISSFGLYSLYAKIIQTLIFEVLPNKQPHRIMKMRPLFKMLNTAFAKEIGSIL